MICSESIHAAELTRCTDPAQPSVVWSRLARILVLESKRARMPKSAGFRRRSWTCWRQDELSAAIHAPKLSKLDSLAPTRPWLGGPSSFHSSNELLAASPESEKHSTIASRVRAFHVFGQLLGA